ncbi:MAG TPA: hypothetical protein VM659_24545 [Dongiaceae bacterium]|nr:hypothetical protein [Dongiaceae bacterium]
MTPVMHLERPIQMTLTGDLLIGAADIAATAGTIKALNPATNQEIQPDFALGGLGPCII